MRAHVLAGVTLLAALGACAPERTAPRGAIVLVSIDTLRADHVGALGYGRDTTPFLDRLARDGVLFERAFAPAPWTLISHMTLLTGLHPHQHGVLAGDLALSPAVPLLAERLRAAGYHTIGLYERGWIHERHGFDRGFDTFRHHEDAEQARAHWREELARAGAAPLFLFVHLFDVHSEARFPLYPSPEPFQELFLPGASERFAGLTHDQIWNARDLPPDRHEALIALYDGGVRHVDTRLEELFEDLDRKGLLEDALVVVTADHGESLAQRGPVRGHGGFRQEGLHVPLVLRLPGTLAERRRAGERVTTPVQLADVVPTILDFVGSPEAASLPGSSLLRPLPPRSIAGGQIDARYLVRWPEKIGVAPTGKALRVDLEADPGELDPEQVSSEDFEALWSELFPATSSFPAPLAIAGPREEEAADLRALGYGGAEGMPGDEH